MKNRKLVENVHNIWKNNYRKRVQIDFVDDNFRNLARRTVRDTVNAATFYVQRKK